MKLVKLPLIHCLISVGGREVSMELIGTETLILLHLSSRGPYSHKEELEFCFFKKNENISSLSRRTNINLSGTRQTALLTLVPRYAEAVSKRTQKIKLRKCRAAMLDDLELRSNTQRKYAFTATISRSHFICQYRLKLNKFCLI